MNVRVGPAGIGTGDEIFPELSSLGITAAEVEFVRRIYMTNKSAKKIGKTAEKFGVKLSVHAPYYINLTSEKKDVIVASKKRILSSCERAHHLGASCVVFHAAYYGKNSPEETFDLVKKEILDMQKVFCVSTKR